MGFIKNALIGITLYEAMKYFLNKRDSAAPQEFRHDSIDIIAGARQTDQLEQMQANAKSFNAQRNQFSEDELKVGADPEIPFTGNASVKDQNDPWKNSLASDDLRAPDS